MCPLTWALRWGRHSFSFVSPPHDKCRPGWPLRTAVNGEVLVTDSKHSKYCLARINLSLHKFCVARPTGADSERTKQQILCAAIRRFGQDGLKGATLKTIAADCGITFATIHHYFGGKADLFRAALDASYAELTGLQSTLSEALAQAEGSLADKVEYAARCALDYSRAHPDATRFLLRATLYEPEARERTAHSQAGYLDVVSRVLGPFLGRSAQELRVPLQGFMFLVTRIAVMSDEDLRLVGGDASEGKTADALADYVAFIAVNTLVGEQAAQGVARSAMQA